MSASPFSHLARATDEQLLRGLEVAGELHPLIARPTLLWDLRSAFFTDPDQRPEVPVFASLDGRLPPQPDP